MNRKNQQGSILVVTIMMFSVLIILSLATLSFMVNENKQAIYQQRKTQAYYIARGGAEAAAAHIKSIAEADINAFTDELPLHSNDTSFGEGSFKLNIFKNADNNIEIQSTGKVPNGKDAGSNIIYATNMASLVLDKIEKTVTKTIEIEKAIFSEGKIDLGKDSTITGDVGTNSDTIILGKDAAIFGKILKNLKEVYPDASMPATPNLISRTLTNKKITLSGNYGTINTDNLTIDTSSGEVIIVTSTMIVNDRINILGSNKVKIFVANTIGIGGTLNNELNYKNLDIYYYGIPDLGVTKETTIYGNIYVSKADIAIEKNLTMVGNIIANGENIKIKKDTGSSVTITGLIYAPNADISIEKDFKMLDGAIICEFLTIKKESIIEYITHLSITTEITSEETITTGFKHGYYK